MKKIIFLTTFLISVVAFSQETNKQDLKTCEVQSDFKEPTRDKKVEKWEKRMPAGTFPSLLDIKKHVAIDNDIDVSKIILLKLSEQAGNGIYEYCVDGKQMKYKRMGTVINRNGENPFDEKK